MLVDVFKFVPDLLFDGVDETEVRNGRAAEVPGSEVTKLGFHQVMNSQ